MLLVSDFSTAPPPHSLIWGVSGQLREKLVFPLDNYSYAPICTVFPRDSRHNPSSADWNSAEQKEQVYEEKAKEHCVLKIPCTLESDNLCSSSDCYLDLSPVTEQRSIVFSVHLLKSDAREFPGGPVVRTWNFHCRGLGSIPAWGTKIPQAMGYGLNKEINKKTKGDANIYNQGLWPGFKKAVSIYILPACVKKTF